MEYRFELEHPDGTTESVCDPGNPLRAPGAFGAKSVVEFPGYRAPAWLGGSGPGAGTVRELAIPSRSLRADVPVRLWTHPDAPEGAGLPLLVVHDGPEYAQLAALTVLLGRLGPARAALLAPLDRDEHYSASAVYARALTTELLPALRRVAPGPAAGLGASLGALALLHAEWLRPGSFAALLLQSGSYFRRRSDRQEAGFRRFGRIARFTGAVLAAGRRGGWAAAAGESPAPGRGPLPVVLTCGAVEENLENNRAMAAALAQLGHAAELHVTRDAHNYVAWRDALDPHLPRLLAGLRA